MQGKLSLVPTALHFKCEATSGDLLTQNFIITLFTFEQIDKSLKIKILNLIL